MLLLFQDAQGEEVLATRMYRTYFCSNGHTMLVSLTNKTLRCRNAQCEHYAKIFVLPVESVELAEV